MYQLKLPITLPIYFIKLISPQLKFLVPSPSPKLEQVMSECDDVIEWVELGAALHISQSDLDNIEHIHRGDVARCRRELFKVRLYMC